MSTERDPMQQPSTRTHRCAARGYARTLIVFIAAFSFRFPTIANSPNSITGDNLEYASLAYNLRTHHTLSFGESHAWGQAPHIPGRGSVAPTAARAPLYPAVLAVLWSTDEASPPLFRAMVFNALAGSVTAVVCERIALALFGETSAWIAGLAVALAPETAILARTMLSETLFTMLSVSACWLWIKGKYAMCGFLGGLAILTRAVFLPLALLGLMAAMIMRKRTVLVVAAVSLLTVSPWTIRNLVSTGSFVPVNTQGWGSNLVFGTIYVPYGSGNPWLFFAKHPPSVSWTVSESETEGEMLRMAVRKIAAHPFTWIATRVHDFPRALEGSDLPIAQLSPFPYRINRIVSLSLMPALLALAVAGCYRNRDMFMNLIPVALPPAALIASQMISLADIRYTLPGVPFLIILASSLVRSPRHAVPLGMFVGTTQDRMEPSLL